MAYNEQEHQFCLAVGITEEDIMLDEVDMYLNFAKERILNRLYPLEEDLTEAELPEKYYGLQVELAVRIYSRKGAEGEYSHSENGVNRAWSVGDSDILEQVTPFAKVVL